MAASVQSVGILIMPLDNYFQTRVFFSNHSFDVLEWSCWLNVHFLPVQFDVLTFLARLPISHI